MKSIVRLVALLAALGLGITPIEAASSKGSGHSSTHTKSTGSTTKKQASSKKKSGTSHKSSTAKRNAHGRIARSEAAKRQFEVQTGYPHGRPGYVVDHVIPLACGGADVPSNMQWQTVETAKLKDKTERVGCR
jgi:hypothetical protein